MDNIIKGCSKERDVIAKQKLFFENLKEMDVFCDREEYYDNSENNQYCLGGAGDSDIDVLTFINILRKGRNNRPFLEIRYLLISGTSLYIEYNPEPGNAKFHSFAISISHITKILWFKLNKGFGIQKRMISFDVVCRAKMALSAITSIEIRKRYDDISERFKNQLITEDTAAACILDYKRNLKAPEDYNQLNVDSTMDFLSDDSIDRVQNESAMKDAKIVELNSQNETVNAKLNETVEKFNQITEESVRKDAKIEELSLQKNATEEKLGSVERQNSLLLEQLNVYKNMELIKKRNSARIKGVVVFLIDVLLLLVTVGLFIFDVVEIVVPFLDSVSSGKGIVISLIGGVLLSGLSLKKIIQLLKKCLLSPLKNKWFSTKL